MTSAPFGLDLVNKAPEGTKLWILHCGTVELDEGWFIRGAGASRGSAPNEPAKRIKGVIVSALIEHPTEGLILYETGAGKDYPEIWGAPLNDLLLQVDYSPEQELDAQIAKTGHDIKDVKAVIMGHLHADHAGGLEHFRGTDIPIYVHELELKHAYYAVATKSDVGAYWGKDLDFSLNWKTFSGPFLEIAPGINIHHAPGHTPGLCIMQVNLKDSGSWIFTTDQYHIAANFDADAPQGWLARNYEQWVQTHQMIKFLQKRTHAKMIFGHCAETLAQYKTAPHAYT